MRIPVFSVILFMLGNIAFAQNPVGLTQRDNLDPWTYKQGIRPKAGDFGYFLSATTQDFKYYSNINPLSYINFRWYKKDDLVFRGGLRLFKNKSSLKGESSDSLNQGSEISSFSKREEKSVEHRYGVWAGVEKHLLPGNMVDVYLAGDLRAGIRRKVTNFMEQPTTGDKVESLVNANSFEYGFDANIGFQTFIADLPLSIAVEAGFQLTAANFRRGKAKESVGGVTTEYQFEVDSNLNPSSSDQYSKLSSAKFDLDAGLRFTLCYFFSK
jgi:hypothetical protein